MWTATNGQTWKRVRCALVSMWNAWGPQRAWFPGRLLAMTSARMRRVLHAPAVVAARITGHGWSFPLSATLLISSQGGSLPWKRRVWSGSGGGLRWRRRRVRPLVLRLWWCAMRYGRLPIPSPGRIVKSSWRGRVKGWGWRCRAWLWRRRRWWVLIGWRALSSVPSWNFVFVSVLCAVRDSVNQN
jgi:hypothetical protein